MLDEDFSLLLEKSSLKKKDFSLTKLNIESILYQFKDRLLKESVSEFIKGFLSGGNSSSSDVNLFLPEIRRTQDVLIEKLRIDLQDIHLKNQKPKTQDLAYRLNFIYNTELSRSYNWGCVAYCLLNNVEYEIINSSNEIENNKDIQRYTECPPYHVNGKTKIRIINGKNN